MSERAAGAPLITYGGPERRRLERLIKPFRLRVTGVDADGRAFDLEAETDNVSAGGFYARLPCQVGEGARLSAVITFSEAREGARAQCLAAHGWVKRSEALPDGACGVAVEFAHHQFL